MGQGSGSSEPLGVAARQRRGHRRRRPRDRRPRARRDPRASPSWARTGRGDHPRRHPGHHRGPDDPGPGRRRRRPPPEVRARPGRDPGPDRLPLPRCPGPGPPSPQRIDATPATPRYLRSRQRPHPLRPRGRLPRPLRAPRPPEAARQPPAHPDHDRRLRLPRPPRRGRDGQLGLAPRTTGLRARPRARRDPDDRRLSHPALHRPPDRTSARHGRAGARLRLTRPASSPPSPDTPSRSAA